MIFCRIARSVRIPVNFLQTGVPPAAWRVALLDIRSDTRLDVRGPCKQ
jgi:hypothetical protein